MTYSSHLAPACLLLKAVPPLMLIPVLLGSVPVAQAQTLQLNRVTVEPAVARPNLVANPSFEQADNGIPAGWQWDRRNTDATCTLDTTVGHSGRQSLHLT